MEEENTPIESEADETETDETETVDDENVLVPSDKEENEHEYVSSEGDEDLENYFSDLLEVMRLDDPDYSVHSRYHIHINHAIDLGDLLIATILALIFIHMFMRDFIKRS